MSYCKPINSLQFSSVPLSCPTLRPHGLQHARLPCLSPTPGVYSNSFPLSWWCHLTISSSVVPFSSHLQSFPASGSFQMSQLFTSDGQSIGVSASALVLPVNIRMDWLDLLAVQGILKSLLQHHSSKASILRLINFSPRIATLFYAISANKMFHRNTLLSGSGRSL